MILEKNVWAIIPARGGSKSLPLKNLAILAGHPLIYYAINAAKHSESVSRIICSTDHEKIADFCRQNDIDVQMRPEHLSGDEVPTLDVLLYVLERIEKEEGKIPEYILLLEPTSPFVLPEHIDKGVELLQQDKEADSLQTISTFPPNHHAYNQRELIGKYVFFRFMEERKGRFNKQLKPEYYAHGNLRIMRSSSFITKRDIFGDRSIPYIINREYALDVDGREDFVVAEAYINNDIVSLPGEAK